MIGDTPNRELSVVGRWLSPDPAASGWNQYAYATNPNSFADPSGLCPNGQKSCGGPQGPPGVGCTDPINRNPNCLADIPTGMNPSQDFDPFSFLSWYGCGEGFCDSVSLFLGQVQQGGNCFYALYDPCGQNPNPANNNPRTEVPANPCAFGWERSKSERVCGGRNRLAQVATFLSPAGWLVNAAYLFSFRRDGALDAQPFGASRAYGNYVFGAYLSAAGIPLSVGLAGANGYAAVSNAQYPGFTMDPNLPAIPQANVANIVNGYNTQQNGTLCHK